MVTCSSKEQMKMTHDSVRTSGRHSVLPVLALALSLSIACGVACAETQWFDGNVGGTATGGNWPAKLPEGVTLSGNRYVVADPDEALAFTASESKAAGVYTNLIVRFSARFAYAYDGGFPELPDNSKLAVAVCSRSAANTNYCVLAKDPGGSTNAWVDTGIPAVLDRDVAVVVTVATNGVGGVAVKYDFDSTSFGPKDIIADGPIGSFMCKGEGELAAISGAFQENWLPPAGKEIPSAAKEAVEVWAKANGVKANELADSAVDSLGRTKYESCMLNLAPGQPLVATADVARAENELNIAVQPPLGGVGSKVKYVLKKNDVQSAENETGVFAVTPGAVREVYAVQAVVDGEAAGNVSRVGSQPISVAATSSYLPVPWTDWQQGDVKVTDLIKASALQNGDQIDVYDAASEKWVSCVYNGTAWHVNRPVGAEETPPVPTLKRGQAFRFTSASARNLHLIGGADAAAVTTTLVVPNKFTLVAKPDGTPFVLNKLDTAAKAKVMGATGLPTDTYLYFDGRWLRRPFSGQAVSSESIPANQGFFLNTTSESVAW